MTNLLATTPVYVTAQDVKDTTNVTDLKTELDADINRRINEAQQIVDDYIIHFWEKYDEDQANIFPIKDDNWSSLIPNDIKVATIYVVESVYLTWAPTTGASSWWDIKSEKVWDHTITYTEWTSWSVELMSEKAKQILDNYKQVFYNVKI